MSEAAWIALKFAVTQHRALPDSQRARLRSSRE
jgi:hypothetical protein